MDAYLECIHVLCKACRNGNPVEWSDKQGGYVHPLLDNGRGGTPLGVKCFASAVWELRARRIGPQ